MFNSLRLACPDTSLFRLSLATLASLCVLVATPALAASADGAGIDWFDMGMKLLGGLALFLFGLDQMANALKATSSVGEAIASTAALVPKPFSEEIDIFVKEIHLGTPLDRAIHALSRRINSTLISGALTAIVVARRTGGNLPQTLERAAAALRETTRLEGVLRSKTAEGRGQVLVLASVPFILGLIILWLDRSWFDPMLDHPVGTAILVASSVAWTFAALWAHQIAKVEL